MKPSSDARTTKEELDFQRARLQAARAYLAEVKILEEQGRLIPIEMGPASGNRDLYSLPSKAAFDPVERLPQSGPQFSFEREGVGVSGSVKHRRPLSQVD